MHALGRLDEPAIRAILTARPAARRLMPTTRPARRRFAIPDPYTGQFDGIGAFREPAQLLGHLRLSYNVSPRVSAYAHAGKPAAACFGGQQTPFTYFWNSQICIYTNLAGGPSTPPVGNATIPGDNVQTFLRYPYEPYFGTYNDLAEFALRAFQRLLQHQGENLTT